MSSHDVRYLKDLAELVLDELLCKVSTRLQILKEIYEVRPRFLTGKVHFTYSVNRSMPEVLLEIVEKVVEQVRDQDFLRDFLRELTRKFLGALFVEGRHSVVCPVVVKKTLDLDDGVFAQRVSMVELRQHGNPF